MKKNIKINFELSKLKYNAIKLRASYQLPSYLTKLILELTEYSNTEYVRYLSQMCEHSLRVKGYYKRHTDIEKEINNKLYEDLLNRTFKND